MHLFASKFQSKGSFLEIIKVNESNEITDEDEDHC